MKLQIRSLAAAAAVAGPLLAGLAAAPPALAATVPCGVSSLISAINSVASGGTITLTSGCTYTLTAVNNSADGGTGLPVIGKKMTIAGNGATIARSAASGTKAFRIFDVSSAGNLTLRSLTLRNGLADNGVAGGGAIFSHGTLTVVSCHFIGNSSPSATGTSGGAINNSGTLTVSSSTFSRNVAQEGGGIFNQKTATVSTSTFTGNTATIFGGGAVVDGAGTLTLNRDTFAGNSGPGGGAIDNDAITHVTDSTFYGNSAGVNGGGAVVNFGTITIGQSTLSGNSSPYGADVFNYTGFSMTISSSILGGGLGGGGNCGGQSPITDGGYNIDTGYSCGFTAAAHSMPGTQPMLEALASNGGPTQTMGLPPNSPALNKIPSGTPGCTKTTDQRGIARPQGGACDVGAYEFVVTSGDTTKPSQPTGLTVTGKTANSVTLRWNPSTDNVGVTGYVIFRAGKVVGYTGGPKATTFTDITDAPSTSYKYQVAAFDGSGNVSTWSAPVTTTTLAPAGIAAEQSAAVSTASPVSSVTITLPGPIDAGDLLVGWFGQYNATGQVSVSDNVNGAWTRSTAATTFTGGTGDIAMYYVQNSAAAPWGLTITITAPSPTYLLGVADQYRGIAVSGALDQAVAASGTGTAVDSGPTPSVGAGELLFSGLLTGSSPGTVAVNGGLTMRAQNGELSADSADGLTAAAGPADVTWTLGNSVDWYVVAAVFHKAP